MRRLVEIGRFVCKDDNENHYTVVESQWEITMQSLGGSGRAMGTKELKLSNGEPVNFIDESTFKIVRSGKIIRKV